MILIAHVQCFFRNKESVYTNTVRSQYFQPNYNEAIIAKKFLKGAKDGFNCCLNSSKVGGIKS